MITSRAQHIPKYCSQKQTFWRNFNPQLKLQIIPRKSTKMITFKAQHILNPAAKKRTFWRNYKPQLQLQLIPKRPTNMISFKAQHILDPAAKKWIFLRNFKIHKLQMIPNRPTNIMQGLVYVELWKWSYWSGLLGIICSCNCGLKFRQNIRFLAAGFSICWAMKVIIFGRSLGNYLQL